MSNQDLLKGKRILVVDDEEDILDSLEDLLSDCELETASTFDEAQTKLNTGKFDLAVLDIMGVDGYKLLDIAVNRKITAVMLTANALSPGDTVKSYKKGAAYYIPKEEMFNIEEHLGNVLEAQQKGKSTWSRWFDKFALFYEKKFGPDWQEQNNENWKSIREAETAKVENIERTYRVF